MNNKPKIPINVAQTNSGGEEGKDLLSCYFQEIGNTKTFHFFGPDDKHIRTLDDDGRPSPVKNGHHFTFHHKELDWTVPLFAISTESLMAIGAWTAVPKGIRENPTGDDPESGTFQAQGGNFDELKVKALGSS